MKRVWQVTFLFSICHGYGQEFTGQITGTVVDAKTQEPLLAVNIAVVDKPSTGAASHLDGTFTIGGLEPSTYSLRVSAIGYETRIISNVVVSTGRIAPVHIQLMPVTYEIDEVVVRPDYFSNGREIAPVSSREFGRTEILRSPGAVQDVQRVVQNLPGVASSTDNINELIVRGGAPFENLTLLDYMEVPSINHYSNQYNSAGPINMLNADMIRDAQFSSGGFPAQYGDKSSSILNISVREGNPNERFASKTGFNMAGLGTIFEGGFARGKGSYIASARQSLLQVVDNVVGLETISLTAIPQYWDAQAKAVYRLTTTRKLSLNFLYGESKITIEGDPGLTDGLRANRTDSLSVESVYPFNKQLIAGLSYQNTFGTRGFGVLSLYTVGNTYDVDVFSDFARQERGPAGEVLAYEILNSRPTFYNHSDEAFVAAKYNLTYQLFPKHELSLGAQALTVRNWNDDLWISSDTARYDLDRNGTFDTGPVVVPEGDVHKVLKFGEASKYYLYASDQMQLTSGLSVKAGLRFDHFTYPDASNLSPRVSATWRFSQATSTTLALGRYHQTHPLIYYGDRRDIGYNDRLQNMYADHLVLAYERVITKGLRLSLETYIKDYKNIAVEENLIRSADTTFWSDRLLTVGQRRSYGVELLLEQKQVKDLFGTLAISLSRTRDRDPRIPRQTEWYPSAYDYPLIVTAQGGRVVRGARKWLNTQPFFIRYPSYVLPLSDEMELSFKYRYQSGRPYTPMKFITWKQSREGGLNWSEGAWTSTGDINEARYRDYRRFDVQWLSRFYMKKVNLNVYLIIMNVFDTKNVFFENYRSDGTIETVYQFAFFPVGGLEVEF